MYKSKHTNKPENKPILSRKPISRQPAAKIEAKPNLSRNCVKPAEKLSGDRLRGLFKAFVGKSVSDLIFLASLHEGMR